MHCTSFSIHARLNYFTLRLIYIHLFMIHVNMFVLDKKKDHIKKLQHFITFATAC